MTRLMQQVGINPVVSERFQQVQHMLKQSTALFDPRIVWIVLTKEVVSRQQKPAVLQPSQIEEPSSSRPLLDRQHTTSRVVGAGSIGAILSLLLARLSKLPRYRFGFGTSPKHVETEARRARKGKWVANFVVTLVISWIIRRLLRRFADARHS